MPPPSQNETTFLVFSDLHAHTHRRFSKITPEGSNTRLQVAIDTLAYIRDVACRLQVKDVLFAGDLFETKGKIPTVVLNSVFRELWEWSKEGIHLVMIPGNHDFALRDGSEHSLEIFAEIPGIHVISRPTQLEVPLMNGQALFLTAVPYRDEMQGDFFATTRSGKGMHVCLTHGIVQGAEFQPGRIPSDDMVKQMQGVISRLWLKPFDLTIAGHVHCPQMVGPNKNILVPGQPYQLHPFEGGQERGFFLVRYSQFMGLYVEKMIPPSAPRFFSGMLDDDHSFECPSEMEVKGNIILLYPRTVYVRDSIIRDAKTKLEAMGAAYVAIMQPLDDETNQQTDSPRLEISAEQSPERVLGEVLATDLVSLAGFAVSDLQRLGEGLLRRAQELEMEH